MEIRTYTIANHHIILVLFLLQLSLMYHELIKMKGRILTTMYNSLYIHQLLKYNPTHELRLIDGISLFYIMVNSVNWKIYINIFLTLIYDFYHYLIILSRYEHKLWIAVALRLSSHAVSKINIQYPCIKLHPNARKYMPI